MSSTRMERHPQRSRTIDIARLPAPVQPHVVHGPSVGRCPVRLRPWRSCAAMSTRLPWRRRCSCQNLLSSTRRLTGLPASLSLGPIGLVSPKPSLARRTGAMWCFFTIVVGKRGRGDQRRTQRYVQQAPQGDLTHDSLPVVAGLGATAPPSMRAQGRSSKLRPGRAVRSRASWPV